MTYCFKPTQESVTVKHARKLLLDIPKKPEGRVVDRTTHLFADLRRCVTKSPDNFKHLDAHYRQEGEHQTDFYMKGKKTVRVMKEFRIEHFSKIYKISITRKRKAMGIAYVTSEVIDLLNNDPSHERHDVIVGKGGQEII